MPEALRRWIRSQRQTPLNPMHLECVREFYKQGKGSEVGRLLSIIPDKGVIIRIDYQGVNVSVPVIPTPGK